MTERAYENPQPGGSGRADGSLALFGAPRRRASVFQLPPAGACASRVQTGPSAPAASRWGGARGRVSCWQGRACITGLTRHGPAEIVVSGGRALMLFTAEPTRIPVRSRAPEVGASAGPSCCKCVPALVSVGGCCGLPLLQWAAMPVRGPQPAAGASHASEHFRRARRAGSAATGDRRGAEGPAGCR